MQMCECADAWQAAVAIKTKKASQIGQPNIKSFAYQHICTFRSICISIILSYPYRRQQIVWLYQP